MPSGTGSQSRAGREPPPAGGPQLATLILGTRRLRPAPVPPDPQSIAPPRSACRPLPRGAKRLGDKAGGSANRKNSVKLSVVFGLRAPRVGHRPSAQARRFHKESRYSLSARSSSAPAEAQRAPSSCSPPPAGASDCATLRVARAQPNPHPNAPPRVRLTAAPLSLRRDSRALRDSFYFGSPPK